MSAAPVLFIAATLLVALGLFHSILGERYIIRRLLRRDDLPKLFGGPEFTAGTIRFAWHITTLLAFGVAAVLVLAALDADQRAIVAAIGITCLACAVLPIIFTRGRHLSWAIFLVAGALCLVAAVVV
ncbi:hypothetical protein K0817_017105 [Microbacterium sp. HD4P20]|uniref:hypothetical protein n=1 Tax=Microbacterium sp. HD4P20 TaxID=2864874 RepID=UPI001C642068|nr:hypothetical protein [Microbacterium sp. HD4P20]MCP2638275.1 hypothetical protein [Microbacterium sp. HD4P20]